MKILEQWEGKSRASLCETKSLTGKLNFVCYTVQSGRVFLLRILNFLREFKGQAGSKYITAELRRDIFW